MKKNKVLLASLASILSIFGNVSPVMAGQSMNDGPVTMTYSLAETSGGAVFHLDTTAIAYTDDALTGDINYHITTTKGDYFDDRTDVESVGYTVTTPASVTLTDSHKNTNTMSVALDDSAATGNLDLTKDVNDSTTYAGKVKTTATKPSKAGSYSGTVTPELNISLPAINS